METMGRLKDGTPFRHWAPPLPLDERWTVPLDPSAFAVRDQWVNLRSSLLQSDQLDGAVARLVNFWSQHGVIPRPIESSGRPHHTLLLEVAIDTSVAASAKTNFDVRDGFLPETTRRQAAEILQRPTRENNDLTPVEIGTLHGLVCPVNAPLNLVGERQSHFVGSNEGAFRKKPIYVMGTDWVMKEGTPPKQIVGEILKVFNACRTARQAGSLAVLRAAWLLYAFSVVHPFYDGNGRVARMLASMVLIRSGRLPFIMPPRLHRSFFDTMADARNGKPQMLIALVAECQIALMESAVAALA